MQARGLPPEKCKNQARRPPSAENKKSGTASSLGVLNLGTGSSVGRGQKIKHGVLPRKNDKFRHGVLARKTSEPKISKPKRRGAWGGGGGGFRRCSTRPSGGKAQRRQALFHQCLAIVCAWARGLKFSWPQDLPVSEPETLKLNGCGTRGGRNGGVERA